MRSSGLRRSSPCSSARQLGERAAATGAGSAASARSMLRSSCTWLAPVKGGLPAQAGRRSHAQFAARQPVESAAKQRPALIASNGFDLALAQRLMQHAGHTCNMGHLAGCASDAAGVLTSDQLKQDGAHAPQVGLGVVLLELQNFRRHVQRRAAQRVGQSAGLQAPRKAKVRDLQHRAGARRRQQQVLRLQVALRSAQGLS